MQRESGRKMSNTTIPLTMDELEKMDGEPVWFELADGKWACYLIYQMPNGAMAMGASLFLTGKLEPVKTLLREGFAFFGEKPEGAEMYTPTKEYPAACQRRGGRHPMRTKKPQGGARNV